MIMRPVKIIAILTQQHTICSAIFVSFKGYAFAAAEMIYLSDRQLPADMTADVIVSGLHKQSIIVFKFDPI